MPSIETIPFHRSPLDHGTRTAATRTILERDLLRTNRAKIEDELNELEKLEDKPRFNLLRRFRQRRALNNWLTRHGYTNKYAAKETHGLLLAQTEKFVSNAERTLAIDFQVIRSSFGKYSEGAKTHADSLLRAHTLPAELIELCDSQAATQGRKANLLDWLSQEPTADSPYGATDSQLEQALLWNADHTERFAKSELVSELIETYPERVAEAVARGELDESWLEVGLDIRHVVIGDIFDPDALGHEGPTTGGVYDRDTKELIIWPYEHQDRAPIQNVIDHEMNHAKGGFLTLWLDEAFTERFAQVLRDDKTDNNTYKMERLITVSLLSGADKPLTNKEASACYIGNNHKANEESLRRLIQDSYNGRDVMGALDEVAAEFTTDADYHSLSRDRRRQMLLCLAMTADTIADYNRFLIKHPEGLHSIIRYSEKAQETASDPLEQIAYRHAVALFSQPPKATVISR